MFGSCRMDRLLFSVATGLIAVLFTVPAIGLLAHVPSDDNDSISDNFISVVIGHPENVGFKLLVLAAILLSWLVVAYSVWWWHLKVVSHRVFIRAAKAIDSIRAPPARFSTFLLSSR